MLYIYLPHIIFSIKNLPLISLFLFYFYSDVALVLSPLFFFEGIFHWNTIMLLPTLPTRSRCQGGKRWSWFLGCALVVSLALLDFIYNQEFASLIRNGPGGPIHAAHPTTTSNLSHQSSSSNPNSTIPNIIHYEWVMKDPNGPFVLSFTQWLSVYSSSIYFSPEAIYIHTDAPLSSVQQARISGPIWTQRLLNIPNVVVNQVEFPTHARNGRELVGYEHQSDFLRPQILYEYGGIYMDFDVLPLRDITALRASGFRNLVGIQAGGSINNGVMMSCKGSHLMEIFEETQHEVYNGKWSTSSVELLTNLANVLAALEKEVLILEQQAFNPTTFRKEGMRALFQEHDDARMEINEENEIRARPAETDADVLWRKARTEKKRKWELDFAASYVLHAMGMNRHNGAVSGFEGVTLEYVIRRKSNYARAAWPAVARAFREGIIPS